MTKETQPDKRIDRLFDEADLISSYTSNQAVEDGALFDVRELSKPSPSIKWDERDHFSVTSNLAFSKGYLKDGAEPSIPNFVDLFRTLGEHMKRTGPDHFYNTTIEFPDGTRGEVYAVQNETGR